MSDVSGGTQDGVGLHRSAMKCARLGHVKCNIPSPLSASAPLAGDADEAEAVRVIWCSLVPHRGWNASTHTTFLSCLRTPAASWRLPWPVRRWYGDPGARLGTLYVLAYPKTVLPDAGGPQTSIT